VDRGKQGLTPSGLTDAYGMPLSLALADSNGYDSRLLAPALDPSGELESLPDDITAYLDDGYYRAASPIERGRTAGDL
jgi:hypothetical protein